MAADTIQQVVARFPQQVQDRYDFSKACYTGANTRITGIECREHGPFSQYASQLRKDGAGCPACGGEVRASRRRLDSAEVLARARAVHGDRYSYDKMVYQSGAKHIIVTCAEHGDFRTLPLNHIAKGQGCPACGAITRGHRKNVAGAARKTADTKLAQHKASFEAEARAVHGDRYDYSRVDYVGRRSQIEIVCPDHGPFLQVAEKHLSRSHGCPECAHLRSKGEAEILAFLRIFTKPQSRVRDVIPPKEIDIWLPEHNLAVEYCGEYWHAARSPEDEKQARARHLEKHNACTLAGARLLTIYESEWHNRAPAIKRMLRNAVGKTHGALMARKCEVGPVAQQDAGVFFDRYHVQGGGGWGIHYGLFYSGKLVACMRFVLGANDRGVGAERVWTLTRYATRLPVRGGASRLFSAFVAEHRPETMKSFSDTRYFSGGMYRQLGFEMEHESEPDYQVWHQRLGLLPKTAWQRKNIPARIRELRSPEQFNPNTDHRSERDMVYLLGARRLFDCGKRRWVWRSQQPASQAADPVI